MNSMKGVYTSDYYYRLKTEQRRRTRRVVYPFELVRRFWVTSDSGNRRMQPRWELLRCGIFSSFFRIRRHAGRLPVKSYVQGEKLIMSITLEPINDNNRDAVLALSVREDQPFVAPNDVSLRQAEVRSRSMRTTGWLAFVCLPLIRKGKIRMTATGSGDS